MKLNDLLEGYEIRQGLKFTLPPTYIVPELQNSDIYRQYRHAVALASARAAEEAGRDDTLTDESAWGEALAVVCYTPQDAETMRLANKIMGVKAEAITTSPSGEAPWRHTASPVRPFVDLCEAATSLPSTHKHGTIALLRPDRPSQEWISNWCQQHGIDHIDPSEMHCTVLYSRNPVEKLSRFNGRRMKIKANPQQLRVLGEALVIELDCVGACQLHEWMRSKGGSHDYPEYIPHLTIKYGWTSDQPPMLQLPPNKQVTFEMLETKPINPHYVEELEEK